MFNLEENILDHAAIYVVAKDRHLKYTYCTENFSTGLGLDSPSQIIGKTDSELFDEPVAKTYQHGDSLILNGKPYINQLEIQPHVDKKIDILVTKNILTNNQGRETGIVCTFVDITGLSFNSTPSKFSFDENTLRYNFLIEKQQEYFTRREFSVFKCLMRGYTSKLIAIRLGLSIRTVEGYIVAIKQKLQCNSKQEVIETAMRYGLGHF
jgi:DNA-binding CsgD family transcriptional regulator